MKPAVSICVLVPPACWHRCCGQPTASVWDGVYTEEQAGRGQALYAKECASCHGASLSGGEDGASADRLGASWPIGAA